MSYITARILGILLLLIGLCLGMISLSVSPIQAAYLHCSLQCPMVYGPAESIPSPAGVKKQIPGWITASGVNLMRNGERFRFVGLNRYDLVSPPEGCGATFSSEEREAWMDEAEDMGVTGVRFWLFASLTENGNDWSRLDELIALARERGITLWPVLENQWVECTGQAKDDEWYREGYRQNYLDYVLKVVDRYKNEPVIGGWMLVNEAEAEHEALMGFAGEVSRAVKIVDPNHLIALGVIGSGQRGAQQGEYERLHAIETIDVLTYHDYWDPRLEMPSDGWNRLAERMESAKRLVKPIMVGESGIRAGCGDVDCGSKVERAEWFEAKMNSFFGNEGAGYLIWSGRDVGASPVSEWDITPDDPVARVMKNMAEQL